MEYKLPDRQKARIELGKRIGFYPAEKIEHSGTVVTKMELTDQDRAIAQKLIDASAQMLMEENHRAELGGCPPVIPARLSPGKGIDPEEEG